MRPRAGETCELRGGREGGFTYVGLLIFVFIMGLMLTVAARVWKTTEQRERETELIYIGHAYRMAISSYYSAGHRFPEDLKDLLMDERFPVPKHHLRRLYPDPMTGKPDWKLIMTPTGQGIMGVASTSQAAPIKQDGFELVDGTFKDADCYCKWEFIYRANRWALPGADPNAPGTPGLRPGQPGPLNPGPPQTYPSGSPGAPMPYTPPPSSGGGQN